MTVTSGHGSQRLALSSWPHRVSLFSQLGYEQGTGNSSERQGLLSGVLGVGVNPWGWGPSCSTLCAVLISGGSDDKDGGTGPGLFVLIVDNSLVVVLFPRHVRVSS